MFRVTNRAPGARGFHTKDRGTVFLEPGDTAVLDLAPLGPVEKAWKDAGEVMIGEPVDAEQTEGGAPSTRAPNPPKLKGSGQ